MAFTNYYKLSPVSVFVLIILSCYTRAYILETEDAFVTIAAPDRPPVVKVFNESDYKPSSLHLSCVTFDGQPGRCVPAQQCYPHTKLHGGLGPLETWVIGAKGTCHFIDSNERAVYGVCCSLRHTSQEQSPLIENVDEASSRIVNGLNTYPGELPFMAALIDKGNVFCGASLLDHNHILTAAHCVSRLTPKRVSEISVILGVIDLKDRKRVMRRVKTVIRHRQFDSAKLRNDIAILTLDQPVRYSSTLSPVCIDSNEANHDGKNVLTAGWGRTRDNGPRAVTLQKVTLQVKSLEDCRRNLGSEAPGGIVGQYICAWAPGRDSCGGDSGGPLLLGRCQIGIVSWGIGCATRSYGIYSRLSSFKAWIDRNRILY